MQYYLVPFGDEIRKHYLSLIVIESEPGCRAAEISAARRRFIFFLFKVFWKLKLNQILQMFIKDQNIVTGFRTRIIPPELLPVYRYTMATVFDFLKLF